jgi:hypothetical protein
MIVGPQCGVCASPRLSEKQRVSLSISEKKAWLFSFRNKGRGRNQLNNHRNVWELQADGSYRQRFAKVRDGSICIHRKLIEWAGKRLAAGGRGGVKKYRKVCSQYPCAHEERGRFLFRRFDFGDKKLHGCRRSFSGSRYGFHRKLFL